MSKVHLVYTTGCFMEAALLSACHTPPHASPCCPFEVLHLFPWRPAGLQPGPLGPSPKKPGRGLSFLLCTPHSLLGFPGSSHVLLDAKRKAGVAHD